MSNLSRKPSSAVRSSLARVVLVASSALLLVVAIFILVSAVASPISRGSGTASAPPTHTVPSTATSRSSPTPASGATEFPDLLQFALGGALLILIVLILRIASARDDE